MNKGKVNKYKLTMRDGSIKYVSCTAEALNGYWFAKAQRLTASHKEYNN